jgi:hypothetical protein
LARLRLTSTVRQRAAEALRRWAELIQPGEDPPNLQNSNDIGVDLEDGGGGLPSGTSQTLSSLSRTSGEPPAHWVELVRHAAPELLHPARGTTVLRRRTALAPIASPFVRQSTSAADPGFERRSGAKTRTGLGSAPDSNCGIQQEQKMAQNAQCGSGAVHTDFPELGLNEGSGPNRPTTASPIAHAKLPAMRGSTEVVRQDWPEVVETAKTTVPGARHQGGQSAVVDKPWRERAEQAIAPSGSATHRLHRRESLPGTSASSEAPLTDQTQQAGQNSWPELPPSVARQSLDPDTGVTDASLRLPETSDVRPVAVASDPAPARWPELLRVPASSTDDWFVAFQALERSRKLTAEQRGGD